MDFEDSAAPCKKTHTEAHELTLGKMYAAKDRVLLAIQLLIEGNSIRSTMRITGLDQNTIMKALVLAGEKCEKLMGRLIVNVPARDVQADEIWSFVGKKQKQLTSADDPNLGDAYCFGGNRTRHETSSQFRSRQA